MIVFGGPNEVNLPEVKAWTVVALAADGKTVESCWLLLARWRGAWE